MQAKEQEREILSVFDRIVTEFPCVEIKYEFNAKLDCWLASFNTARLDHKDLDSLCEAIMKEKQCLCEIYNDDAPLFCIDQEWFQLSDNALSYRKKTSYDTIVSETFITEWSQEIHNDKFEFKGKKIKSKQSLAYPIAA